MFTGIIEQLGRVRGMGRKARGYGLEIEGCSFGDIKIGESIAVNGVCLTLTETKGDILCFDIMPETLSVTNLSSLRLNDKVNLERALRIGDRLSGHFVTGHIDCIGVIRRKTDTGDNFSFEIAVPAKLMNNIVHRGSIAVEGISLTIADRKSDTFSVCIIPHTLKNTTLNLKHPSDKVNIEFDILAKGRLLNPLAN